MGRWEGRGGPREARKAERVARGWRERERTERERKEEKTEATTVGKTRKWQEMGRCELGTGWLPQQPPGQLPLALRDSASTSLPHAMRGGPSQRQQKDPQQVGRRRAKLEGWNAVSWIGKS